jgi:bacterioferritin (cytochrome b1)
MIMRLPKRPALGIAALPTTPHNTIDEILTESIQREEAGVELYRELLDLVKASLSFLRNMRPGWSRRRPSTSVKWSLC